jgi:TonB family protein
MEVPWQELTNEAPELKTCLTNKYFIAVVFCSLSATWSSNALAEDRRKIEGDLRRALQHRLLSLRNPSFGPKLIFDSSGNLVNKADAGPWSTCGLIEVEKISLRADHAEIEGKRALLALRSGTKDGQNPSIPHALQATALVTDDRVRILVEMAALEVPQVNLILAHVFEGGRLDDRVAAYWKPNTTDLKTFRSNTPNAVVAELEGNRPVYLGSPGVVDPPKPTHTPDPTYTENARQNKLQGTAILLVAVNEKGFPEVLEITQSLGEGLDTQALAAVAGWRFQPEIKDGQPVAALVNVEVNFHLY